ncbi:MAG: hypothetical protein R3C12_06450 [Planctomycetaceae bacterium]
MFPLINTAKKASWFTYEEPKRKGLAGTFTRREHPAATRRLPTDPRRQTGRVLSELLELFDTLDTTEAELLTTTLRHHPRLPKSRPHPDRRRDHHRLHNWHEEKKKFDRKQVVEMLAWMREDLLTVKDLGIWRI